MHPWMTWMHKDLIPNIEYKINWLIQMKLQKKNFISDLSDGNVCWSAQMPPPPRMHNPNATIILKNCSWLKK